MNEDLINIIKEKCNQFDNFFDNILKKHLEYLSNKLLKELYHNVSNIDSQFGLDKYLTNKYNYMELLIISEEYINQYIKPLIESNIYEKMSIKFIEKFKEEFSKILLEIVDIQITSNDSIIKFFKNKVNNIIKINYDNIIKLILNNFPRDDLKEKNSNNNDNDYNNDNYNNNKNNNKNYNNNPNRNHNNLIVIKIIKSLNMMKIMKKR